MKSRPVLVLAALGLLAVLLAPSVMQPRPASACTVDPEFDPIAEMDVAFAGTVVGLRVAEELWDGENAFVPVWVDFEVDRYLKGDGPERFSALDAVSVIIEDPAAAMANDFDDAEFAGLAGACGALAEDPRGQYWVTAVDRPGDHYQLSLGLVIATGATADDPAVVAALAAAEVSPSATGHGLAPTAERGIPPAFAAIALAAVTLAILAGARLATRERRSA